MKAARVLRFGPPGVIITDDLPRPEPAAGQLLVRVKAAGVGNWDALVRQSSWMIRVKSITVGFPVQVSFACVIACCLSPSVNARRMGRAGHPPGVLPLKES
jgi:NADPH:quinone reductase-like Zn-dependent oxidoreductase